MGDPIKPCSRNVLSCPNRQSWLGLGLLALAVVLAGWMRGWAEEKKADNPFLGVDDHSRAALVAAEVVGVGHPLGTVAILQGGRGYSIWEGLSAPLGNTVEDKLRVPPVDLVGSGIEDNAPIRSKQDNPLEAQAYDRALVAAAQTSREAFAHHARKDVTYVHLWEEPHRFRGEVVHVEGRLINLRRYDSPRSVWNDGIREHYEGWIFNTDYHGANPYCVVFTHLPAGLEVADKMDRRVSFDGYFFKKYLYKASDSWREAPLLIGHTVVLQEPPKVKEEEGLGSQYLTLFVCLIALTFAVTLGLAMWYRRGDQRIQQRLLERKAQAFVEPGTADSSGSEWERPNSDPLE